MENKPSNPKPDKPLVLALMLALFPSVLVLVNMTFSSYMGKPMQECFYTYICFCAMTCSFASSALLFRRKTILAILFGFIFLLINGSILISFGCSTP